MIINHKYQFIYLKTRKTASTSIEIALRKFCDANDIITPIPPDDEIIARDRGAIGPQNYNEGYPPFQNHSNAAFIKEKLGVERWNSSFKFCFERNPFDKAISRYYWDKEKCKQKYEYSKAYYHSKNKEVPEYIPLPEINDYLSSIEEQFLSSWNIYTINNRIAVDFIGRHENLLNDLKTIKDKLGLPNELSLPEAKKGYRLDQRHYSKILNEQTRFRIEKICSREMEMFGYHWTTT
ncbi:hypothetical protein D0962_36160 [Leptolyngbyaceae cyanobacterium CCMR0082]|uniref:Sulfotransferase family protein n=1 Tax=Adonisia turfae CCMR0082 TaxID=2304604 RepID=A0A6M0SIF2_9CYAN|nr:sulfotransferase family 2 domain-containing protein [Adonisia turfae]NEZ68106.1 hypothetical protein [Adonisia turfae CCMR0082]